MNNAISSAANLAFLVVGLLLGMAIGPRFEKGVAAAQSSSQSSPQKSTPNTGAVPPLAVGQTVTVDGFRVTGIAPALSAGDVSFYRILSHRIQTDELVANGYNLVALHQGELNLLSRLIPKADIDAMIQGARTPEMVIVATKPAPNAAQPTPANKK